MRLVLDTNVVVSAMLWGGSPKLLLQARREKRVELYTSTPLLAELTDILCRRKFEKKIAASMLTVDQLVDRYAELAQVVRPTPTPRIVSDPDDDVVIGTALRGKCRFARDRGSAFALGGQVSGCENRRCCRCDGVDRGAVGHLCHHCFSD